MKDNHDEAEEKVNMPPENWELFDYWWFTLIVWHKKSSEKNNFKPRMRQSKKTRVNIGMEIAGEAKNKFNVTTKSTAVWWTGNLPPAPVPLHRLASGCFNTSTHLHFPLSLPVTFIGTTWPTGKKKSTDSKRYFTTALKAQSNVRYSCISK